MAKQARDAGTSVEIDLVEYFAAAALSGLIASQQSEPNQDWVLRVGVRDGRKDGERSASAAHVQAASGAAMNGFNVPMFDGTPREVALVWRLSKRGRHAECRLWTHPLGAEVRVDAAGDMVRTEAARDPLALVDVAMTWRIQFQQKGWI